MPLPPFCGYGKGTVFLVYLDLSLGNNFQEISMALPRASFVNDADLKRLYARLDNIDDAIRSFEKLQRISAQRETLDSIKQALERIA